MGKKTYTKPKKIKRTSKSVKLRVLQYYAVRLGQGGAQEEGVPRGELQARRLHGRPLRPPLLRPLRPHLRLREVGPLRSLRPGDASPLRAPLASEGFSNSNHM